MDTNSIPNTRLMNFLYGTYFHAHYPRKSVFFLKSAFPQCATFMNIWFIYVLVNFKYSCLLEEGHYFNEKEQW